MSAVPPVLEEEARVATEMVARRSYGKLVAFLAKRTRNVEAAEDALSEAFAVALTDWPLKGIPANPEAWLMTAARHKTIDASRRQRRHEEAGCAVKLMAEELQALASSPGETQLPDDRLALMFACAHPANEPNIRAPLILQTILGFDAATIASAFLIAPATMGQRLVRAKRKIKHAGIPFRVPDRSDLAARLDSVLEAIYAAFAEGWSDPAGTEVRRRDLAEEGIWLGRLIVSLLPDEPEALGLLALMLFAEARRSARRDVRGDYVPLEDQDTALWDTPLIEEAEALLFRASSKGAIGRYQLEAAIQSAHVVRRSSGRSDWAAIERLYDALAALTDSPVVAINRAIAIAETRDASAGLAALDAHSGGAQLDDYQPYWAARADLLARTGHPDEADIAYKRAIGLESDPAVRRFLQRRRMDVRSAAATTIRTN
jgi:RNA polymerase sigma-70 factor, ECF subfamily